LATPWPRTVTTTAVVGAVRPKSVDIATYSVARLTEQLCNTIASSGTRISRFAHVRLSVLVLVSETTLLSCAFGWRDFCTV
jgi:hypothetical protein